MRRSRLDEGWETRVNGQDAGNVLSGREIHLEREKGSGVKEEQKMKV